MDPNLDISSLCYETLGLVSRLCFSCSGGEDLLHYCQVSVDIEGPHSDSINPQGLRFFLLLWGGNLPTPH